MSLENSQLFMKMHRRCLRVVILYTLVHRSSLIAGNAYRACKYGTADDVTADLVTLNSFHFRYVEGMKCY